METSWGWSDDVCWKWFQDWYNHHRTLPILSGLMLNLNKCYLVFALSMNMIWPCLLQYGYSFKIENNCYSIYMNNTFYGHAPNVNGLLNLDHSDTHIRNIDAKRWICVSLIEIQQTIFIGCMAIEGFIHVNRTTIILWL